MILAEIDFNRVISFNAKDILGGPFLSTMILCALLIILSLVIFFKAKKAMKDPLAPPKGIFLLFTMFIQFMENLVKEIMGDRNEGFTGYISCVAIFLFSGFIFSLTGLPSPVLNLSFPLILATSTFIIVQSTAIKHTHWGYFHRFIEPIPVFLPINLVTMWAPLLSMALRLFGNATAGYCIMTCLYYLFAYAADAMTGGISAALGGMPPFGPNSFWMPGLITPVFHLYFDFFSGFIQTTVFIMLTMINIYQEQPEDIDSVIEKAQYVEQQ